jgi:isoleucyl-tRNA synthetase
VVDGEGKKMSKSLGNVIAPQEIISKYGADILRLWVATSDYREDIRISPEILKGLIDTYRKIRNTLRFLLGNMADFKPADRVRNADMREIDRYALHRLNEVIAQVRGAYDTYEFHRASGAINNYCTVFLSGFYLDALKDTLYCDPTDGANRRSAQTALWEICSALTRLVAPILSFTAEETWRELRKKDGTLASSVFLADLPAVAADHAFAKEQEEKWELMLGVREKALQEFEKLRKDKKIGSNLEAHLDIRDAQGLAKIDPNLLRAVLGTWDISITAAAGAATELSASPSAYEKCDRCWRRVEDVGDDKLCHRCADAIKK